MDLEKEDLSTKILQLGRDGKQKKKNEYAKFYCSIYNYCGKVLPLFPAPLLFITQSPTVSSQILAKILGRVGRAKIWAA